MPATAAVQDADSGGTDQLEQLGLPPVPPPEVTKEQMEAANADIPFYNMRVEMSNTRTEELCAALARTSGNAQGLPAVNHYFARYFDDDAKLLARFPAHANFIRNMDYKTRLLQLAVAPEWFRRACTAE